MTGELSQKRTTNLVFRWSAVGSVCAIAVGGMIEVASVGAGVPLMSTGLAVGVIAVPVWPFTELAYSLAKKRLGERALRMAKPEAQLTRAEARAKRAKQKQERFAAKIAAERAAGRARLDAQLHARNRLILANERDAATRAEEKRQRALLKEQAAEAKRVRLSQQKIKDAETAYRQRQEAEAHRARIQVEVDAQLAKLAREQAAAKVVADQNRALRREPTRYHERPTGSRWNQTKDRVLRRDRNQCQKCGGYGMMHVDHVIPLAKGGHAWDTRNLQSLCATCNLRKGTIIRSYTTAAPGVYANGYALAA